MRQSKDIRARREEIPNPKLQPENQVPIMKKVKVKDKVKVKSLLNLNLFYRRLFGVWDLELVVS
jgi:hypothetical protein